MQFPFLRLPDSTEDENRLAGQLTFRVGEAFRHAQMFWAAANLVEEALEESAGAFAALPAHSGDDAWDPDAHRATMAAGHRAAMRAMRREHLGIEAGIMHLYHLQCALEFVLVQHSALTILHSEVPPAAVEAVLAAFKRDFPHTKNLRDAVAHIVELAGTEQHRRRNTLPQNRSREIYTQGNRGGGAIEYVKAPGRNSDEPILMRIAVTSETGHVMMAHLRALHQLYWPLMLEHSRYLEPEAGEMV